MKNPSRIPFRLPVLAGRLLLLTFIATVPLAGAAYAESVTLAWDASTDPGVAGYNVYRSEQSGVFGSMPRNGGTLIIGTSYTDSAAQPGHTYYYVVTAVSTTGEESNRSAEVRAVIPSQVTNAAPVVQVASSQTITLPQTAILSVSASDDGLPNGVLSYQWSKVSGAGVSFNRPSAATTHAAFASAGIYTLRVTVSDGQLSSIGYTTVYVLSDTDTSDNTGDGSNGDSSAGDDSGDNGGGNGGDNDGGSTTTVDDPPDAPTTVHAEVTIDDFPPSPPTNLRRSRK